MENESKIVDKTKWIRCQSKSHPNRYYLFNKTTGQTVWCSETSSTSAYETQKIFSAKNNMKTPAQDRLKRLQNNLEKSKSKESPLVKAKESRKKLEFSNKIVNDAKNDSLLSKNLIVKPSSTPELKKLETSPNDSKPSSHKILDDAKNEYNMLSKRLFVHPSSTPELKKLETSLYDSKQTSHKIVDDAKNESVVSERMFVKPSSTPDLREFETSPNDSKQPSNNYGKNLSVLSKRLFVHPSSTPELKKFKTSPNDSKQSSHKIVDDAKNESVVSERMFVEPSSTPDLREFETSPNDSKQPSNNYGRNLSVLSKRLFVHPSSTPELKKFKTSPNDSHKIIVDAKNESVVSEPLFIKPSITPDLKKFETSPNDSKQSSNNYAKNLSVLSKRLYVHPLSTPELKKFGTSTNGSKQTPPLKSLFKHSAEIEKSEPIANKDEITSNARKSPKFKIPKVPRNDTAENSKTPKRKLCEDNISRHSSDNYQNKKICVSVAEASNEFSSVRTELTGESFLSRITTDKRKIEANFESLKKPTSTGPKTCDINANEKFSKEDKMSGILSKIQNFCNYFHKKTLNTKKEKLPDELPKSNLSIYSKPSFKNKIQTKPSDVTGNANQRLQCLRKSLQAQQTSFTPARSPYPATSQLDFKITSIPPPSSSTEEEPMDWQPISEDFPQIITNSSVVMSEDISTKNEHYDIVNENLLRLAAEKKQISRWKAELFYFVVDTNVFLDCLTFVEDLTTMKLCDTKGTLIYVPYCVLQELDKLKIRSPSESVKTRSTRAIKFLNKSFQNKDSRIQAQSAADENKRLIKVTSPDDSILNCCLQVKKHIDNVLLLTEDINLRNKALSNDILVSTKSDLVSKHESRI